MLTAYNGTTITYDALGNPLTYYNNRTFAWEGRQMSSATLSSGIITFEYNDNGTRVSKTKGGVTTAYYYDGTRLIAEQNANETIIYIYDDYGSVIGMQYRITTYAEDVWDVYWFERNLQGDIVAVYNTTGTKLISYTYDACGNFTTIFSNGGENTTAIKNPFRYRGYYYDQDLGLYYLQTRYYDSVAGRFISPDDTSYLGINSDSSNFNLYAYCGNSFVMHKKSTLNIRLINTTNSPSITVASIDSSTHKGDNSVIATSSSKMLGLFGYELRTSAGWNNSPYLLKGFLGVIGFSTYTTYTQGQQGVLYAFAGSTTDSFNLLGTTYYAGVGLNLFDVIGAEIQLETFGIGAQVSVGNWFLGANVNLTGLTSITIGNTSVVGDGVSNTNAFTIGVNTGLLFIVLTWLYQAAVTGNVTPPPVLAPS